MKYIAQAVTFAALTAGVVALIITGHESIVIDHEFMIGILAFVLVLA